MVELKLHEQKIKKKMKHYKHIYLQSHLGTMFNSVLTKKNQHFHPRTTILSIARFWLDQKHRACHSLATVE